MMLNCGGMEMLNLKKIILSIIVILGFIFIIDIQTVQAESNLEIKVKKSVSVKFTDCKEVSVRVYYQGKDVTEDTKFSFNSSKKSIVKVNKMEDDEDFYVNGFEAWPKKVGKSTITITAKYRPSHWDDDELEEVYDGETITVTSKCVVNSQYYSSIRAYADLINYNTRNNTFTIKVNNISNKKIKIMSTGAMAFDDDYTAFDRKIRLAGKKSSITIKPGQTKKVKFKVIGKTTWYNYNDFQICSYWKWGNKKYWVSVKPGEETWRKQGKKWKWIGFAI